MPLDWFDGGADTRGADDLCGALRVGADARGADDRGGALRVGARGAAVLLGAEDRGATDRVGAATLGALDLVGGEELRLFGLADGERCCTGADARGRDAVARGVSDERGVVRCVVIARLFAVVTRLRFGAGARAAEFVVRFALPRSLNWMALRSTSLFVRDRLPLRFVSTLARV